MNILITGCGSGLGRGFFEMRKDYSHNVFPHFREPISYIPLEDDNQPLLGDITDPMFYDRLSSFLEYNDINVFVNNAALHKQENLLDTSDEDIIAMVNTNLTSQILILKRVYKFFKEKGDGLIININSVASKYPSAKETIYSATKSGLSAFSKALQLESIGDRIEIVDFFPGAMQTRMTLGRDNYETLMNVKDVAAMIYDVISNDRNISMNEIVIRKRGI